METNTAPRTYTIDTFGELPPLIEQLVALDGWDATIVADEPILNGSGRTCGRRLTISSEVAALLMDEDAHENPREAEEWAHYFEAQA